jgi:hypothetical protein
MIVIHFTERAQELKFTLVNIFASFSCFCMLIILVLLIVVLSHMWHVAFLQIVSFMWFEAFMVTECDEVLHSQLSYWHWSCLWWSPWRVWNSLDFCLKSLEQVTREYIIIFMYTCQNLCKLSLGPWFCVLKPVAYTQQCLEANINRSHCNWWNSAG